MKSALNGGLNLSILDGWWDEWYDGENGWAIPTADGVEDPDRRDDLEAAALYELVETQVAPRFYDRDERGLPVTWLEMVRHTLATLGPKVQSDRMVTDYVEELYVPATTAGRALDGPEYSGARELAAWKRHVGSAWAGVRVDHVDSVGLGEVVEVGSTLRVKAYVSLGELSPADVEVQVVYGKVSDHDELDEFAVARLEHSQSFEGGRHEFTGDVRLERSGSFGYTVRVVPHHPALTSPAETGLVANA